MVECIPEPTIVEEDRHNQASKSKNLKDPLEDSKLTDLSFADSFLDFDSIKEFFEESSVSDTVSLDKSYFVNIDKGMEIGNNGLSIEPQSNPSFEELRQIVNCSKPIVDSLDKSDFGKIDKGMEMGDKGLSIEPQSNPSFEELRQIVNGSKAIVDGSGCVEEEMGRVSLVGVSSPICSDEKTVGNETEMGKVSLVAGSSSVFPDGSVVNSGVASDEMDIGNVNLPTGLSTDAGTGSHVNNVVNSDKDDRGSDSESASESSSSSDSSSDGDEEEEGKMSDEEENEEEEVEGEIEEGEIRNVNGEEMVGKNDDYEEEEDDGNKMVEWSETEFDDIDEEEEGDAVVLRGPIRSKNELTVLPPIPSVDATLQPHHQMQPVGAVLSIISAQVIVEGVEKHNPLNEGSILWITENRSPLGIVDEIFGPVQYPYYMVRYNSESEVPAGICQGTLISFVSEFANHILGDKNLYKKGYDASGENDEELSDDAEFSDDEKEAEYRRMQKMSKRGMNYQTFGNKKTNRKKVNHRNSNWRNNTPSGQQTLMGVGQSIPNQNQHNKSSIGASMNKCSSSTIGHDFHSGSGFFPPFSSMAPTKGVFPSTDGVWVNGLPCSQSQNAVIPGGITANNISWPGQNQLLHPCQMPFQQQFNPSQGSLPNGLLPGGQINLSAGPLHWPGQNSFNLAAFGMGFQIQPARPTINTMNIGSQGMMSNGLHAEQNSNLQPPSVIPAVQSPQQFNLGASSSRGRKPYHHRGGSRFAGGRGQRLQNEVN